MHLWDLSPVGMPREEEALAWPLLGSGKMSLTAMPNRKCGLPTRLLATCRYSRLFLRVAYFTNSYLWGDSKHLPKKVDCLS